MIAESRVSVDGQIAPRASLLVEPTQQIAIAPTASESYVSRGGLKLAAALDRFGIDVVEQTCLDLGASTGGFTDCLLRRGAAHVTAIDVGHGQMAAALLGDARIDHREGVNARHLTPIDFPGRAFGLVVGDLSFISLTLVLPAIAGLLSPGGQAVLLVKPQFEVGQSGLGKGGIVRNAVLREQALQNVLEHASRVGLREVHRMESPITGTDGNTEYLIHLQRQEHAVPAENS